MTPKLLTQSRIFARSRVRAIEKPGIANRIAQVESDPVLGYGETRNPKRFYLFGPFIVRADHWSAFTRQMRPDRRKQSMWMSESKSRPRLLLEWLVALVLNVIGGPGLDIATRADVILVQRNVRLFYLDRGFTAKVARIGKEKRVRRELEHRRRIEKTIPEIPAVPIRAVDSTNMLWMIEEIVEGRHATCHDDEVLLSSLCPSLARQYEATWSATELVRNTRIGKAIRQRSERNSTNSGPDSVQETLDSFLDKYVMIAVGHGDIRLHNIIISREGKPFLIDWERSHSMPVVLDILDLACASSRLGRFWNDWLSQFESPEAPLLRPEELLLIRENAVLRKN